MGAEFQPGISYRLLVARSFRYLIAESAPELSDSPEAEEWIDLLIEWDERIHMIDTMDRPPLQVVEFGTNGKEVPK